MNRFYNILCWTLLLFMLLAWVSIPLSFSQDVWWFKHDPYAQVAHWEGAGSATEYFTDISSTRVRRASGHEVLPATAFFELGDIVLLTTDGIVAIPHILSTSRWERLDKEVKAGAGLNVVYATDSTTISADPTWTPQPTATPTPTFSYQWTGGGSIAEFVDGATWNFPDVVSGFYQEIVQPTDAKHPAGQKVYFATHNLGVVDVFTEVKRISNNQIIFPDRYVFSSTQVMVAFYDKPDYAFGISIQRTGTESATSVIQIHDELTQRNLASNHPQYLHRTDGGTVTGPVTFSPPSASPPFFIGANALNETVTGLSAQYWNKVQSITFHATKPIFITDTTANNERNVSIEMTPTPTFTPSPTPTPKAESGDFYSTAKVYNMFHDMQHPFIQIRNADSNYQHHLLYIEHGSGFSKAVFFDNSNQSRFSYVAIDSATSIPFGGTGRSYTLDPGYGSTTQSLVQIERGGVIQDQSVTDLGDGTYRVTLAQPQTGMQANFIIADGTAALGDGTSQTVTLTHNSNTFDVVVQFFLASTGQFIYPDTVNSSTVSIQAHFPYAVEFNSVIAAWKAEPTTPTDTFNEFGEVTIMNDFIRDSRIIADHPEDRFILDFKGALRASGSNVSKKIDVSVNPSIIVHTIGDDDSLTSNGDIDMMTQAINMRPVAGETRIVYVTANTDDEIIQSRITDDGVGQNLEFDSYHGWKVNFDTDQANGQVEFNWDTVRRLLIAFDKLDFTVGNAWMTLQAGIIPGTSPAGDGLELPELEVFEFFWMPTQDETNNLTYATRVNTASDPVQLQGSSDGITWIDLTGEFWQTPMPTVTPRPTDTPAATPVNTLPQPTSRPTDTPAATPTLRLLWYSIVTSDGDNPVPDAANDTLTFLSSGNINISGNATNDIITFSVQTPVPTATRVPTATPIPGQNLWYTISTSSGTSPQADALQDTLTFIGSGNITVTGDSSTDIVTISAPTPVNTLPQPTLVPVPTPQDLAGVLTEGNTANMDIDMATYAIDNITSITVPVAQSLNIYVGADQIADLSYNATNTWSMDVGTVWNIDGNPALTLRKSGGDEVFYADRVIDVEESMITGVKEILSSESGIISLNAYSGGSSPGINGFIGSERKFYVIDASTTISADTGFDIVLTDSTGQSDYSFYENYADFRVNYLLFRDPDLASNTFKIIHNITQAMIESANDIHLNPTGGNTKVLVSKPIDFSTDFSGEHVEYYSQAYSTGVSAATSTLVQKSDANFEWRTDEVPEVMTLDESGNLDLIAGGEYRVNGYAGYGGMYQHDSDTVIDATLANQWTIINGMSAMDLDGFSALGDHSLVSLDTGKFKGDYAVSFAAGVNTEWEFGFAINGQIQIQSTSHRTIGTANDLGNTGGVAILDVSVANSVVTVVGLNESSTTDATIGHANWALSRVGQ